MIPPTDIPVVQPLQVRDDARFLKWLACAQEAAPVAEPVATEQAEAAPPSPLSREEIDSIPEAIVVKHKGRGAQPSGSYAGSGLRPVGRDLPGARLSESPAAVETEGDKDGRPTQLDTSLITSMEDYNEGKTRVEPLKRIIKQDGDRGLERPKFLDGKLPRSVERGVLHPQPTQLVVTSVLLIASKLLLVAVLITLPVVSLIDARELIPKTLPLLVASLVMGVLFVAAANRARCRVCSCHFFFVRHCHKHKSSHKIPLVGRATTAALHLLLFKWMRCMYCGTAIRLRGSSGIGKPKRGETDDEGFVEE